MKKARTQQATLRQARKTLNCTTEELGTMLGKSRDAVLAWLAPSGTAKHRNMPAGARLLLDRIVAEHRATKRRGAR